MLAAGGTIPAVAAAEVTSASAPDADAELARLADLATDTCRRQMSLPDGLHIPPEVDAEAERLSRLKRGYLLRAASLPAHTATAKCAKAKAVALANSCNMACESDPAFITLESLLDDLMGGKGAVRAFYAAVFGGTVPAAPVPDPDAELIALCAAHDDLERRYRASFEPSSPFYVEDDDERDRVNDPLQQAQEPLVERICAMRGTTPESWRARARSILLWDANIDPAEDALCPGHTTDRRMMAALFRDMLAAEGA